MNKFKLMVQRLISGDTNNVFRSVLLLAMGTGMAKAIGLLAIPILTRLYSPEDFGLLSVFAAAVNILAPIATLRYVVALPLPHTERAAINILALCVIFSCGFVLILGGGLWLSHTAVFHFFSADALSKYWWLMVLAVAGSSAYEIASMWVVRKRAFRLLARSQISQMLVGTAIKLCLGFTSFKSSGLLVGQVFQQTSGVFILFFDFSTDLKKVRRYVSARKLRLQFSKYIDYFHLKLPAHFFYVYAAQAPVLLASRMYGEGDVGQLGLTFMALALPTTLICQNMSTAYYGEISRIGKADSRKILAVTINVIKKMFFIGCLVSLSVFLLAPYIFEVAFGVRWAMAGQLARAQSLYIAFQFVASPLIMIFNVYDRQMSSFSVHFVRALIVSAIFFGLSGMGLSLVNLMYVYSVCLSAHYLYVIFMVLSVVKNELK